MFLGGRGGGWEEEQIGCLQVPLLTLDRCFPDSKQVSHATHSLARI